MRFVPVFCFFAAAVLFASDAYPPPRFTDPERVRKLESAFPEVDQIFRRYASERKIPGMVWGVVIDGRLAHVESVGVRDRSSNATINAGTEFRIASMTKSFTTLAILKLRDDGKLSLEDPVSKWLPEFARMELPTRDTAPLRIRQLLSHSSGLPGGQSLGRSATQRQRRRSDAMAPPRHSFFHAARHALRILQLRLRPPGPHCHQSVGDALREVCPHRDSGEATHGCVHL